MTAPTTFHPTALCQCGCGEPAPVAPCTLTSRGWKQGEPRPYRRGHQAKTRPTTPLADRFWPRVDRRGDDECWPWLGYVRRAGYGLLNVCRGKAVHAHRIAYELLIGPIPTGLDLDHLCRNTLCVNPAHLEPVTRSENLRRAHAARKTNEKKEDLS